MRPLVMILAIWVLSNSGILQAQDRTPERFEFTPPGTVIVTGEGATLQIAEKEPRPIATGAVLTYSRINENWLWIDAYWGWIDRSQVVPLDKADAYYTNIIESIKAAKKPAGVALHQRGIVRLAVNNGQEALADFDAAIADEYTGANVYINRGQALKSLGQYDEAIDSITEAIKREPANGLGYDARAVVLAERGFLTAALVDADKAVELAPNESRVWYDRGFLRQQNTQFKDAIGDYNEALKLSPRYVEAVTNRAYCQKRIKRYKGAADDLRKALDINPKFAMANNDLAWLLATCPNKKIRSPKEAVQFAETAAKASKRNDGRILDTLATAYAAAGQWDAAVKTAEEAIKRLDGADLYAADQRLAGFRKKEPFVEK